jgi:hypothetical protein
MLRPGETIRRLHELREQSFDFSIRPVLQEGRDAELEDQECPRADHQDSPAPGGFVPFVGPFVVTEQIDDHQCRAYREQKQYRDEQVYEPSTTRAISRWGRRGYFLHS